MYICIHIYIYTCNNTSFYTLENERMSRKKRPFQKGISSETTIDVHGPS